MPVSMVIQAFLNRPMHTVVIDVRSEAEYAHAHIPGAINIPLLNDEQRRIVGTTYSKQGHEAAVVAGFELVGPEFASLYQAYRDAAGDHPVIFYCWRGGLRSRISATLYEWGGAKPAVLTGGYKNYRRAVLNGFAEPKILVVLSGFTGTGKTEILSMLREKGHQVLDLEGLAHHRGSALGHLGMPAQESQEMFENRLFGEWQKFQSGLPVFVENESRKIGANVLPEGIWEQMQQARVLEISVPREQRLKRILKEYGGFDREQLRQCTEKVSKRLGGLNLKHALEALKTGDIAGWAGIMTDYYDRSYLFGRKERPGHPPVLHWDWGNPLKSLGELETLAKDRH